MKKTLTLLSLVICLLLAGCGEVPAPAESTPSEEVSAESSLPEEPVTYSFTEEQIQDKILGGWVGQMAGVVYGAKSEFQYWGTIMPEADIIDFSALNINDAFWQDDLYVEMTFLEVMETNGLNASLELLGEAFAKSEYSLDHANKQARENLQKGIAPALCGHYDNNLHCDDIDWQIEADFLGLIYGGDPMAAANRSFEIGHMICYGDGVYGGVFVSALTAAAFLTDDIYTAVEMALQAVPQDTEYKTVMSEVLDGYEKGLPWEETWQAVQDKWGNDDRCVSYYPHGANIDAKINSAYVLMGLLYGEGDFEKSMTIAMRCGQDSDCNPSTVGGVLGTMLGYEKIPKKYKNNLDTLTAKFSYTNYTLQNAVDTTAELFKSRLTQNGEGLYTLTPEKVSPVALEQWPESPVMTFSAAADKDRVTVSLWAYSVPGIRSTLIDFGDGFVAKDNVAGYRYSKNGTYTITCTVTDVLGNTVSEKQTVKISGAAAVEDPDVGTYRNLAPIMLPICSDSLPTGSGSKDIYVINDGKTGGGNTMQYDTYCGYFGAHDEYVGYLFKAPCTVDTVTFTEGMHFGNGGWFSGGTLKLQAFKDGAWVDVEATVSPAYPVGNSQSVFGSQFEVYTFTFEEITCDGIRLFGTAGGDAGFISVSELAVMGVEAAQ